MQSNQSLNKQEKSTFALKLFPRLAHVKKVYLKVELKLNFMAKVRTLFFK